MVLLQLKALTCLSMLLKQKSGKEIVLIIPQWVWISFLFFFTFFVQNDGQYMHLIIHFICSSYWDIWKDYSWNAIIPRPPSLLVPNIYYHLNAVFYQWSDQHIIDLLKQREEGFGSWEERWNKVKWFKLGRNHVWLWL